MLSDSGIRGQKGNDEVSEIKSSFFSLTTPCITHKDKIIRIKEKSKLLIASFLKNNWSEERTVKMASEASLTFQRLK